LFYTVFSKGKNVGRIYGFPIQRGQWCTSDLKTKVLNRIAKGHLRADVLSHSDSEKPGETRFDKGFSGSASIEVVCEAQDTVFSQSSLAQGVDTNIVQLPRPFSM
jgi:hypothetical protein